MIRDSDSRALAALLLTCACAFTSAANAQVRIDNGVVIRPDLKGSPWGSGTHLAAANPGAEKICSTDDMCQTPILVSPGGLTEKGDWDPDGCSVYWPYSKITVRSALQPALRWVLVKDPADPAKYVFDATYGIRLSGNDPQQDLFKAALDHGGTAFTWYNLHFRAKKISFVPNVWRLDKHGKEEKPCNAGDPDVVNEN